MEADYPIDLQHAIDTQMKLMLLLFANKNSAMNTLETFVAHQAKHGEARGSTIGLLKQALNASTMRLAELEEELKIVCATSVGMGDDPETVETSPGKDLTKMSGHSASDGQIDERSGSSHMEIVERSEHEADPTLPGEDQEATREDIAVDIIGIRTYECTHESINTKQELKRIVDLEAQVLELKEQITDLEAKGIGREIELAAGRHREGKMRQENTRLLDERETLYRKIPKSPPTVGTQNAELDASRKRERLALEKLKQQREHNAELKIVRDLMRKKLVELSTQRDGLESALQEAKTASEELKTALEESQANLTRSQVALDESKSALDTSTTALGEVTSALGESQFALGSSKPSLLRSEATVAESEKAHVASQTALETSREELSESKAALSRLKTPSSDSISKQQFHYATALVEHWRESCLSEREVNIHFLSQLTTSATVLNDALRHAKDSVSPGANPGATYCAGVEPAIYRIMSLINLELNRRAGKGQEYRDWVGIIEIRRGPRPIIPQVISVHQPIGPLPP
jgi:hypothetical protein